jgi:uncharacterized protein (TIGR03382 family)
MFVSTNAGATWQPRAVPFDAANDRAPFVSGVDPTSADRVYVRTSGTSTNNLFVSETAGQSFQKILTAPLLAGFALSADGATIYSGGPSFGLSVGTRTGYVFAHKSDVAVQCLARVGTMLFSCSDEKLAPDPFKFILGESDDDGVSFSSRLHLNGLRGPLACAGDASESACLPLWPALKNSLGIEDDAGGAPDAGSLPDGGTDGGTNPNNGTTTSSCGCGATPADAGGALGLVGLVAALMLMARRSSQNKQ